MRRRQENSECAGSSRNAALVVWMRRVAGRYLDRHAADCMIRCLTIKDEAAAYAITSEPGFRFSAQDVRAILERSFHRYGVPACLHSRLGYRPPASGYFPEPNKAAYHGDI